MAVLKIIADDRIPFLKGVLEPWAEVKYLKGGDFTNLIVKDADALIIRTRTKCNEDLLKGTSVKFIATATIGFDHIDSDYCHSAGIEWTNAPGCNSSSVKQYITAALLKLERDRQFSLKGKTLGVVGAGNVGSKVAEVAGILGMSVLVNDPPRERREGSAKFVSLEHLLKESDIVTLHVPLNITGDDRTYHLIGNDTIGLMKRDAWLFNTSRGEVADNLVLKKAMAEGRLAGIVLDVWENEPDIDTELMSNVFIATPHIAGYSADGKANGTSMAVNALSAFFGLPLNSWYPNDVPLPPVPQIELDCHGKSTEDITAEAVFHTYSVEDDDRKLRDNPSGFESQRGQYPLRREFPSYMVKLRNHLPGHSKILTRLGFRLIT